MVDKLFVATKALIVFNNKILILRESNKYSEGSNSGRYDVVGGRLKIGEKFDDALLREIKEETSLDVDIDIPIAVNEWKPKVKGEEWQIVATFFICYAKSDKVTLSEDHNFFLWIEPEKYKLYNIIPTNHIAFENYLKHSKK